MEKELKRLIRILKAEYALMWVLTVLLAALYECDILPQGLFAGDAQMEYIMQVTSILLTICLIPLSLRLFNLSLTRHIAALPLKNALKSYRRWSEIRIALLTVASLASLSAYYWTMDTTGLLCTGMTVIASLFCVPGKERLLSELNLSDTSLSE
ncbi:hypothetical protein QVO10_02595 [Bacteroides gallinaceum]|uniref:Transmembrane protein n=2 Tax=Bacteroidaceae TaxID=815 RepID=A0ABT7X2Y0_9BACE|nr:MULTISPECIES: hypothetical protein [Bacteroidaceae]CCZ71271.1 putative uncharacterized protein [Bacteroides sp. CAG:702]HJC98996.1 hypothetical protein [Candidatus Phocaeicola merdavium]HJD10249.1 hypothetical protein [Candidatus Phocaeicola caecigallinarum]MBD8039075.1 hypothetical protein [Phocaeicola intestinalis]MBM6658843.1 hypothetical protein [Bacteroides gallinaceum]